MSFRVVTNLPSKYEKRMRRTLPEAIFIKGDFDEASLQGHASQA
jgi:hypothetical protein